MKNYLKAVISALCILAALLSFASCDNESKNSENSTASTEYYTVSFNTKGGTPIASVRVQANEHIERPNDPLLEDMVFYRWTHKGRGWDFHLAHVEGDMTLDAEWLTADSMFHIDTIKGLDGIAISGIKLQKELHTLTIPSIINGLNVVAVTDDAFESGLMTEHAETVVFPSTLTYVGAYAFHNKSAVQLIFTSELSFVGESAFENCTVLTDIQLTEGMDEIAYRAFAGCTALRSVDIPNGIKIIKENAFDSCSSMTYAVLPSTLTAIENSAFDDCSSLKAVFFGGDEEGYKKLEISRGNGPLEDAKVYFFSSDKPTEEGKYWHYDKTGAPTLW